MFVVHGPVKPDSPAFVARPEVLATIAGWLDRGGCVGVIMGAQQTGKTTMCFALRALAHRARVHLRRLPGLPGRLVERVRGLHRRVTSETGEAWRVSRLQRHAR